MELWIRSQDREMFVKCNCIEIMWSDGLPNLYVNGKFPDYIVGNYLTKEEALEVLDEIQELLIKSNRIILDPKQGCSPMVANKNVVVYEMPL